MCSKPESPKDKYNLSISCKLDLESSSAKKPKIEFKVVSKDKKTKPKLSIEYELIYSGPPIKESDANFPFDDDDLSYLRQPIRGIEDPEKRKLAIITASAVIFAEEKFRERDELLKEKEVAEREK